MIVGGSLHGHNVNTITINSGRPKILYALSAANGETLRYKVMGLESAAVYAIDHKGLRAVVSDTLSPRVRPERRNITAHQAVLHSLLEQQESVLPMRFGVIARNAETVKKLLETNQRSIKEHLERLKGRVEMGLRVSWDTSNIYEYFVATHQVLREARDEVWSKSNNVKRDEKVELGQLYESLRTADRTECSEKVKDVLLDYCEEDRKSVV
jgi:hypothetical protein